MTIKDVARHCGVSVSTVSRALNDRPDVSAAVRDKVLKAVEELHYVPNSSARELVMPAADSVGLVIRGDSQFYGEIVANIENSLRESGYSTVIESLRHGEDELRAGAALVRSKRLRGLIFLGGCFDYSRSAVEALGVPFVCCTYRNVFGTLEAEKYSSVTIDDIRAGYEATDMLISRGHRRIAVVLSTVDDRSVSQLRYMGYRRALEERGLDFDPALVLEAGEYSMSAARRAMEGALEANKDFSAVFAVSDSFAIAVMKALHDKGKNVPGDVSVVGIDGMEMCAYTVPTLCSYAQPAGELGRRSAELIIEMMEGAEGGKHILLDPLLTEGGSVRSI